MNKTQSEIVKPTFEAVFNSQEQLRKHLRELVEENRPLKDDDERDLFMSEIAHSTLGLGTKQIIQFFLPKEH